MSEWRYTITTIFEEFLGIHWVEEASSSDSKYTTIQRSNKKLRIANVFFRMPPSQWLRPDSIPDRLVKYKTPQLLKGKLNHHEMLLLFGVESECLVQLDSDNQITIMGDLLGSAFFLLSGYEEVVSAKRDSYGRFPFSASLACQFGFVGRALVNEYTELIYAAMLQLWPEMQGERKPRTFAVNVSHDIDHLFYSKNNGWVASTKRAVKAVVYDKNIVGAGRWIFAHLIDPCKNPYFNLRYIMSESEKRQIRSSFYFLAGSTDRKLDGDYEIDNPLVVDLLREIGERGHEIGLHPSFETFKDPGKIQAEFHNLQRVVQKAGIRQSLWGGRQHYLRWEPSETARGWEAAGLDYDSTIGYAEQIGFRCGTCYEFTLYDLYSREPLQLRERPLNVMDVTVIDSRYLGHGVGSGALNLIKDVKQTCREFEGDFNLLWHNTRVVDEGERKLYLAVLDA